MNDLTPAVLSAIKFEAKKECYKFGLKDWEDIAQDVTADVWEKISKGQVAEIEEGTPLFHSVIKKYTKARVHREMVAYMHFSGAYLYPRPAVVHILENLVWGEPGTIDETESKVDVRRSYDRMNENYRLALYKRYALGIVSDDGGERKQCTRALDALTNHLNFTTSPGPLSVEQLAENE